MISEAKKIELCSGLDNKGWAILSELFSSDMISHLYERLIIHEAQNEFRLGEVGQDLFQSKEPQIRKSSIFWIENWDEDQALKELFQLYNSLLHFFNQTYFLSIKRFESQFAIYEKGGFYKKHLDQLKKTKHRQISSIIYLSDCHKGGELILYSKNDKKKIDCSYSPRAGDMVIFFSRSIYHEVKETEQKRYGLTTWFRDDELLF